MRKVILLLLFFLPFGYLLAGTCSAVTDYFRSAQTGDWGTLAIWESSPDNVSWTAATIIPNSAANTISIKSGHIVTVSSNQNMDQVQIENGGILFHSAGTLTVNDAAGNDIEVLLGGVFTLASGSNAPVFTPSTAIANINTAGTLRISASGLTGAGTGVNANNYNYQNASVLEYTLNLAFSSAGVTFFPNANAATIPIFRTTSNLGLIGAGSSTTFNGVFEANGTVTFQNAGTKTFRNGITGTGNISSDPACGKFIINGSTAILGGTGSLTLPTSGMDIGPTATVSVVSNKAITGNISLLTNSFVTLGNYDLTLTGDITGGSLTAHVVTDGIGRLLLNNVLVAPRIYPIGANTMTYNPVTLQNGGGLNYGLRVELGINPAIAVPVNAVNRTWFINSGAPPGSVDINFFYTAADCNAGWSPPPATLELGLFYVVWNVVQSGLTQAGAYQVSTAVNTFGSDTEAPLVLANLGAILAIENAVSVNYFTGIKQSGQHLLKWQLTCNSTPAVTLFLQRSKSGVDYETIFSEHATALRCQQPFNFTDAQPVAGINYYRIKMIDIDGKISYSKVVTLINAVAGIDVMDIAPNPLVNGTLGLGVSAAAKTPMEIMITDIQGRLLQKQSVILFAGFNTIPVNVKNLAAGTYQLAAYTTKGKTRLLRFVIQ